jgi:hypothetical protein
MPDLSAVQQMSQTGQNEGAPGNGNCGHSTRRASGASAASGWPIHVLEGARASPNKARMAAGRDREGAHE